MLLRSGLKVHGCAGFRWPAGPRDTYQPAPPILHSYLAPEAAGVRSWYAIEQHQATTCNPAPSRSYPLYRPAYVALKLVRAHAMSAVEARFHFTEGVEMTAIMLLVIGTTLAMPLTVAARGFTCTGLSGPIVIEASSESEALYKAEQARGGQRVKAPRCQEAASEDIFVRDIRFKNNSQLRPYLPADLRPIGKRITCDKSGGFLPDGDSNAGSCEEFSSVATGTAWKVRAPFCQGTGGGCSAGPAGKITKVWKKSGQTWKEWVEWEWADSGLRMESAEARSYAAANGANSVAHRNEETPQPAGLPPSNRPEDLVRKGVADLLKGLIR